MDTFIKVTGAASGNTIIINSRYIMNITYAADVSDDSQYKPHKLCMALIETTKYNVDARETVEEIYKLLTE